MTDEKCSKWPREVCSISKEYRSKSNPVTKCEKIPQQLCGPAGCGFVPGPEQCHDEVKTVVTDIPNEVCDLTPERRCKYYVSPKNAPMFKVLLGIALIRALRWLLVITSTCLPV